MIEPSMYNETKEAGAKKFVAREVYNEQLWYNMKYHALANEVILIKNKLESIIKLRNGSMRDMWIEFNHKRYLAKTMGLDEWASWQQMYEKYMEVMHILSRYKNDNKRFE